MKRLFAGFTLAEALITMAIIGLIASITLPTLNYNITKQQVGPAFAKAINSLENANKLALVEGSARTLDQLAPDAPGDYLGTILAPHLRLTEADLEAGKYTDYAGSTPIAPITGPIYTTSDGISFIMESEAISSLSDARLAVIDRGYSGRYYAVYIDVNGANKGPNSLGKDLLYVYVDTKGAVIPFGGEEYSDYRGTILLWNISKGNGCANPKKAPSNARYCAGSIADHGFKVVY